RARAGGNRRHMRDHSRSDAGVDCQSKGALSAGARLSRHLPRRRSRPGDSQIQTSRPRSYRPCVNRCNEDQTYSSARLGNLARRQRLVAHRIWRNTTEEADAPAKKLMAELKAQSNPPAMRLMDDPADEAVVWEIRDAGLGASARVPDQPDTWEGWEDSAVSPKDIGNYLRDFRALLNKHGYLCTLYGHFGQGLVHTRV